MRYIGAFVPRLETHGNLLRRLNSPYTNYRQNIAKFIHQTVLSHHPSVNLFILITIPQPEDRGIGMPRDRPPGTPRRASRAFLRNLSAITDTGRPTLREFSKTNFPACVILPESQTELTLTEIPTSLVLPRPRNCASRAKKRRREPIPIAQDAFDDRGSTPIQLDRRYNCCIQ